MICCLTSLRDVSASGTQKRTFVWNGMEGQDLGTRRMCTVRINVHEKLPTETYELRETPVVS